MKTTITPSQAKEYLEKNTINRNVNATNLAFLTKEIKDGNFKYNGESIIISEHGTLMDGQHRLMAAVAANMSITVNLVLGVVEDCMSTINTGKPRGGADVLSMFDVKNSHATAATIKKILERYNLQITAVDGRKIKIANHQILEFYNSKKEIIIEIIDFSNHLFNVGTKILTPAYISGFIYLMSYEDNIGAIEFFREIMTGVKLRDSNVAQIMRTRLINEKISKSKMTEKHKAQMIIKAIRLYSANLSRKFLRINDDEDMKFMLVDVKNEPDIDFAYLIAHGSERKT